MHSYIHYYPSYNSLKEVRCRLEIEKLPNTGNYFFALHFHIDPKYQGNHIAGYIGFQLVDTAKKAIFSLWHSIDAVASNGFEASDINEDGPVKKIIGSYNWQIGKFYDLCLKFNNSDISFSVEDENDDLKNVGTQRLPNNFSYKDLASGIDLFVEWFGNKNPTTPIRVIFSNFSPLPEKLEIEQENTLNCNMKIEDNNAIFEKLQ